MAVAPANVQHVVEHDGANAQAAVGRQAAQRHDVETARSVRAAVLAATHGAHHDVVEEGCKVPTREWRL